MAEEEEPNTRLNLSEIAQSLRLISLTNSELADVVYIAIASEEWESTGDVFLELGIAVFDTAILASMDFPSPNPQTLVNAVFQTCSYAHYRFVEHARHVNTRGEIGRPEHFGFGSSTGTKTEDAEKLLRRILDDPTQLRDAANFETTIDKQDRKIILIRHGMGTLDRHMSAFGISVADIAGLIACYDTATMVDQDTGSLASLMAALCLPCVNMRNSGNEAAYSLHAMVIATVLECQGLGLVENCIKFITSEPNLVNAPDKAAIAWGGTAVEGDEVKLAMDKSATKMLKKVGKAKNGNAGAAPEEPRALIRERPSKHPIRERPSGARHNTQPQRNGFRGRKVTSQSKAPPVAGTDDLGGEACPSPQALAKRKGLRQTDRFFHNLGRR